MALLELQNVSKSYRSAGRTVDVLSHVDLEVADGHRAAVLHPLISRR